MSALEILSELAPKPAFSLYQIEVFSVSVTLVVYVCMLIIAYGIVMRGTSFGVPLKNFLSGLIMSSLSVIFAEPGHESSPAYLQNNCGVAAQLLLCFVILAYSPNFNRDARLTAAALVLFSILMNLKHRALLVTFAWSLVNLIILPGMDFLNSRKSEVSRRPDTLTLTLMLSGSLSLLGWGTYIYMLGFLWVAAPYFAGALLTLISLKDMYSIKIKAA